MVFLIQPMYGFFKFTTDWWNIFQLCMLNQKNRERVIGCSDNWLIKNNKVGRNKVFG